MIIAQHMECNGVMLMKYEFEKQNGKQVRSAYERGSNDFVSSSRRSSSVVVKVETFNPIEILR